MQLKEIDRNKIIEHKKRLEKHKKAIKSNIEEVVTREQTAKENLAIKIKKKAITKKAFKERQKVVAEKVMDDARKGKITIEKDSLEEEPEEPKVTITKEERAERFKRLHTIAQDMMKKWNETI